MTSDNPELDRYLDDVSSHIGHRRGKKDVILELRSAILDRAEELAGGPPGPDHIRVAIQGVGDPAEVALAYAGERYLIGPRYYRAFFTYTVLVFAIHLVMMVVATVTNADIEVFPVSILRVSEPRTLLNLFFVAVQALLLDIGLMVVIFTGVARVQRSVRLPNVVFRVPVGLRPSITRAILALLVLAIANLFRDSLFVVAVEGRGHPLLTRSFVEALPWLNALLIAVLVKETAYAFLGERRYLVGLDALLSAAGAALMIHLLSRPALVAVPMAVNEPSIALPTLNQLLGKMIHLLLIAFAAVFALEAGKRAIRFVQMWR